MGIGVSISAMAKDAKVSRSTMWRRIKAFDTMFPELHLLAHTQGQKRRVGKYQVNARALDECWSRVAARQGNADVAEKLNIHEGIFRGLKTRIKRLERRLRRIEGSQEK
jgi:hypothetical protein